MGRMSELHAQEAPERAERLENECHYLEMCIQELSDALRPFVAYIKAYDAYSETRGFRASDPQLCVAAMATGNCQQASLTLGDLRKAAEALAMHGTSKPAVANPLEVWHGDMTVNVEAIKGCEF